MDESAFDGTMFEHAFDWANQTNLHPLAVVLLLLCGILLVGLPRRWAVLPMAVMACAVVPSQRLYVLGLNFDLMRMLLLFGWSRILIRGEWRRLTMQSLDWCIVLWAASGIIIYTLQWGTFSAFVNRFGVGLDAIGTYWLFRCLVRDMRDVEAAIAGLLYLSIPVVVAFGVEYATGRNCFAVFGYVPELTLVREGRLRCQGAFAHPILAGCFWASLIPLFVTLWWERRSRYWSVCGVFNALCIVCACGSSTPLMAVVFSVIGGAMFILRHHMRAVRWSVLAALIGLHVVMTAPVWHLISRINIVGGSTSWHRYHLIDEAIKRCGEWWLLGTRSTVGWDEFGLLVDITNQYVLEGVRGGFLTMTLFVATIWFAFAAVGRAVRAFEIDNNGRGLRLAWALGVCLFVHCMNYLAVNYFGQIVMLWHMQLAMIGGLAAVPRTSPGRAGRLPRAAGYAALPAWSGRQS